MDYTLKYYYRKKNKKDNFTFINHYIDGKEFKALITRHCLITQNQEEALQNAINIFIELLNNNEKEITINDENIIIGIELENDFINNYQ